MARLTRNLLGFLLLSGTILVAACSREAPSAAATPAPAERRVATTVAEAEGREVQRSVQIVGTLLAQHEVTLANEVPATVARILVDLGDPVKAGQLVLKLDDREARLEVERLTATLQAARDALERARQLLQSSRANQERARAVLADAALNLTRFRDLFAEGAISASQRDSAQTQHDMAAASLTASEAQVESDRAAVKNAEAGVEQAAAALELARKRLGDTDVLSPIDGFVRKRFVNPGETFKEKSPLLALVATDALKLQGDVPERFAPQIGVGRAVQVTVEAYPDQVFPGRLTRVSPVVDVENRSFTVEASVPNPRRLLKPGFFAKASILVGRDAGVPFVPEEAVVSFAGIVKVYVVADGRAEERRVRTGQRVDGRVEILEGVRVGERVATSNLSQLATGTAVTVQAGARTAADRGNGTTPNGRARTP
ncbi:MAG: efflux RND transporter periplasmic adaptor subunit [Candidatus Methylomirabilales bacterium]